MSKCDACKCEIDPEIGCGCKPPASSGTVEGVVGATFIHPDLKVSFRVMDIRPDMFPYIGGQVAILERTEFVPLERLLKDWRRDAEMDAPLGPNAERLRSPRLGGDKQDALVGPDLKGETR